MRVTYKIVKGIHKDRCDDSALVATEILNDSEGFFEVDRVGTICIGDGVGGNAGGDEASLFVMKRISDMKEVSSTDELRMQIILINNALIEYAKSIDGHELMATTLTGLFFSEEKTFIVQCGNTRAYVLQGSFLKQITRDQTTYQWLVATGNIEAAEVCNKSEIRGALGGGNKKFIDTLVVEEVFERGIPKMILLTSDGIHDVLNIDEIEDIVTDSIQPEEKIGKLIHTAIDKGSEDDCTAVIIEEV